MQMDREFVKCEEGWSHSDMPRDHSFSIRHSIKCGTMLRYEDLEGAVEVMFERSPNFDIQGFTVWERDFSQDPARRKLILDRFVKWAEGRKIRHTVIYTPPR